MWSVGVLLYEMTHRSTTEPFSTGQLAANAQRNKSIDFKGSLSTDCANLLSELLTPKQADRPTIKEIFKYPWMIKQAAASGLQFGDYLDQNKGFINMDESLSAVRSRYRGSSYLQENQAEIKAANLAIKGRLTEGGNFTKAFGSTTRDSMVPFGVSLSPHM